MAPAARDPEHRSCAGWLSRIGEPAPVQPDQHRTAPVVIHGGRPDIQHEAILALWQRRQEADRPLVGERLIGNGAGLRADRPKTRSIAHAGPALRVLRHPPAQVSNRRFGEWDTFEDKNVATPLCSEAAASTALRLTVWRF